MRSKYGLFVKPARFLSALVPACALPFIGLVLLLCTLGTVSAAPANWIRYDQGLPFTWTSGSAPKLFTFGNRVYGRSDDDTHLFLQLYNAPCFGWREVTVPAGSVFFKAVGSYLYATAADLWWIGIGDNGGFKGGGAIVQKTAALNPIV